MKKCLFSLLLLLPFFVKAQPVIMPPTGIERGLNSFLGGLKINGPVMLPRMASATNVVGLTSDYFVGPDSAIYSRDPLTGVISKIVDSTKLSGYLIAVKKSSDSLTLNSSSGLGDVTLAYTSIFLVGDSKTESQGNLGSGADRITSFYRQKNQPLEKLKCLVNFGGSGHTIKD